MILKVTTRWLWCFVTFSTSNNFNTTIKEEQTKSSIFFTEFLSKTRFVLNDDAQLKHADSDVLPFRYRQDKTDESYAHYYPR